MLAAACGRSEAVPPSSLLDVWLVNERGELAAVIDDADGIAVDVQSVDITEIDGARYLQLTATGIPGYDHVIDGNDVAFLNGSPNAATISAGVIDADAITGQGGAPMVGGSPGPP